LGYIDVRDGPKYIPQLFFFSCGPAFSGVFPTGFINPNKLAKKTKKISVHNINYPKFVESIFLKK
jgi:hypothetical protein